MVFTDLMGYFNYFFDWQQPFFLLQDEEMHNGPSA
jgi:hypothetical protein